MSEERVKLSDKLVDDITTECRRVCAMCYALSNDATTKYGQIAHLDHKRTNNRPSNLAYLCLAHHDEYDTIRRQTRRYKSGEIKRYKALLKDAIKQGNAPKAYVGRSASLRMKLHDSLYDSRLKIDGREAIFILVSVSNSGEVATCIEDVNLYWNGTAVADERRGLGFFGGDDEGDVLAAWWRRKAEYLQCDSSQMIKPGRVRRLVAPMLFQLPDGFPDIDQLSAGGDVRVELEIPMIFEAWSVIGAPVAVEVPFIRAARIPF